MRGSKVVEMLRTFSPEEFRGLEKFAESRFHRRRDVSKLLKILRQYYPDFKDAGLNEKNIFEKLFPGKIFEGKKSDSLMKTLTSELFLLCKDYLIQLELQRNKNIRQFFLLNQLRRRMLHKELTKELQSASAFIETPGGEANNLIEKYILSLPIVEFYIDLNDYARGYEMIIRQTEFLVAATLTKCLRFSEQKDAAERGYNIKTRNNLSQSLIKNVDIDNLIAELRKDKNQFLPHIEISNIINEIFVKRKDIKLYFRMKNLLMEFLDEYSHSEKYIFFSILSNYAYRIWQDKPDKKFKRESFEIYVTMLKLGFYKFSTSDFFQVGLFRNMLIEARTHEEFEWMRNLIDNYTDEIHPEYRESMRQYSMGQYYFATGEFGKALESLAVLKPDYFLYKKDLKNLLFRIYYNLGYYEEAYSILDSLKHYLSDTKHLSEALTNESSNFAKLASELLHIRTGTDFSGAELLKKKILDSGPTESRDWLIEKTDEMIKAK